MFTFDCPFSSVPGFYRQLEQTAFYIQKIKKTLGDIWRYRVVHEEPDSDIQYTPLVGIRSMDKVKLTTCYNTTDPGLLWVSTDWPTFLRGQTKSTVIQNSDIGLR